MAKHPISLKSINFMKIAFFGVLFFTLSHISFAQSTTRTFTKVSAKPTWVEISTNDGTYQIGCFASNVVQTTFIPSGQYNDGKSHAVIASLVNQPFEISENELEVQLKAGITEVRVQKKPFQIQYWYANQQIISEKNGYHVTPTHEVLDFTIQPDEVLYGGGARALGMNRRGNRLELYNKANYGYENTSALMNFCLPIVLSSSKYMLHFDNPQTGFLDLDSHKDNSIAYETEGGNKTYQVIFGKNWEEIIQSYTALTGTQPLPPKWAFGNFSSRFGYHSEQEARATIDRYFKDSIPVDAIILDLYWFGKDIQGTMGNLEFYKDSFPTPNQMIADFKAKGVKTVLISEPFILSTSSKWKEAVEKQILAKDSVGNPYRYDFYFGNTGIIDIYSKPGKMWFWNIYKNMRNQGVSGFWGDLGEPEVHPKNLIHAVGKANTVHNIYGHDWARLIQEGFKQNFPSERPFILMRAGYSGSQRFGMIPWSGDVNRSWGGLRAQPEIALQMGMQGIGYMHSDLGGFAGTYDDNELYIRWLQYGVFQPIFRPHAQEQVPSEPVFKDANTKRIVRNAIQLRYDLLPYNYTLAYLNSTRGLPFMRPLFFEEPTNKALFDQSETYLWGNAILVSPILEKGKKTQVVYFPTTSDWIDFYTGEIISKGSTKVVETNLETIPTYVRAGAFIPMSKKLVNTEQFEKDAVQIHFYYTPELNASEGLYFYDDGKTPADQPEYTAQIERFTYSKDAKVSTISLTLDSTIPEIQRSYTFILHTPGKYPKTVKLDGKRIQLKINKSSNTTEFVVNTNQKKSTLQIKW